MSFLLVLWRPLLELFFIWALIYYLIRFFQGTRAIQLLMGLVMLAVIFNIAKFLELNTVNWVLTKLFAVGVLAFLIEHCDRIVSKEELIAELWGGKAISDSALNSCINAVRRAVGDDGKTQAVVKTFPRRGMRFIAEVKIAGVQKEELPNADDRTSIAVLPFANLSDDREQDYFSEGMAEEIRDLRRLSSLTPFAFAANRSSHARHIYIHSDIRELI